MHWPNDADGDVLRRIEAEGFDFSSDHTIDFNIDFNEWPLSEIAKQEITELYPSCEFIEPDEEDIKNGMATGYVQFQLVDKLTYELVTEIQKQVTNSVKRYGGWCESWGVWQQLA